MVHIKKQKHEIDLGIGGAVRRRSSVAPQFAIMRCTKLKTSANIRGSLKHLYRDIDTPNADDQKTPNNLHLYAESTKETLEHIAERMGTLKRQPRKNAIQAVEYMMTASPEFFEVATEAEVNEFFQNSLEWLKDKYGEENIMVASVHLDESTPHMTAMVTPITKDGRLSAKELIGNKAQMTKDQTSYAKSVQNLGLKRGIEKSRAKHKDIKTYYAELAKSVKEIKEIPAEEAKPWVYKNQYRRRMGVFKEQIPETLDEVAERLNKRYIRPLRGLQKQLEEEKARRISIEDKSIEVSRLNQVIFEMNQSNKLLYKYAPDEMMNVERIAVERANEARQKRLANRAKVNKSKGFKI